MQPHTAAHQAPPSLGFSRQEHWSGLPFPSPMHESEKWKWKWSRSVVSTLSDPMDCSLPGSSVHGIFQARVLEWGAIAFSNHSIYPACLLVVEFRLFIFSVIIERLIVFISFFKYGNVFKSLDVGSSLLVQWLRCHFPMRRVQVWTLVRWLRSHMPHGQKHKT